MAGVNDTGVEVCCSVVIMDGVGNDDKLVMQVLYGVKTEKVRITRALVT